MLIDRPNFRLHLPWVVASLAVAVLSAVWYVVAFLAAGSWQARPGGSSLPGFTFGVLGGLICVFEFLLWPRKKKRAWRLGRVQVWMRAHVWLGLLSVPLLVFHSGFRWGGTLSAVLMVSFLVVIASGVWGLVVQQFLPRRMLDGVPAETIYSQINHILGLTIREADRLVLATCGPEEGGNGYTPAEKVDLADVRATHRVVGAVRSAGRVQGVVLQTVAPAAPVPDADYLRVFYRGSVRPFLEHGAAAGSVLAAGPRAAAAFRDVRTRVNPAAHGAVAALEDFCEQRRQLDRQALIHVWLHCWLWVHLPLSVALVLLMFVHTYVALKYW